MRMLTVVAVSVLLAAFVIGCGDTTAPSDGSLWSHMHPAVSPGVNPVTDSDVVEPDIKDVPSAPAAASALATTLDFEGLPFSTNETGVPDNPASILTNDFQAQGVLFGKAGASTGVAVHNNPSFAPSSGVLSVVGLDAAGIMPSAGPGAFLGDIYFSFVAPGTSIPGVTDMVSFTVGDAGGDLDVLQIRSYDALGNLIDLQDVNGNSRFSVSINVAGIHRVEVDFNTDFGYSLDDLSFNTPAAFIGATLDIKPTSCPNPVNVKSKGVVPAAILGSAAFDVTDIDVSTILLEGVAPIRHNYSDVAEPFTGEPCDCSEDGPDGFTDLTLKFRTQDLVAAIPWVEDAQELTLTGYLLDGTPFELSDCVWLRGLGNGGDPRFERTGK